jgi:cell division protein FtsZ
VTVTKIIGIGGSGKNAVNRMIDTGLSGVEFITADFDVQSLWSSKATANLVLKSLYSGLTFPEFGNPARMRNRESALARKDEIRQAIGTVDVLVMVAGFGGHTSSGAAPVIAEIVKQKGVFTVGVFMLPFKFEGKGPPERAYEAINEIRDYLDVLMTISPDQFLTMRNAAKIGLDDAFRLMDDVLNNAVRRILDFIGVRVPT